MSQLDHWGNIPYVLALTADRLEMRSWAGSGFYNLLMRPEEHPARRPTRYHWAAGLNPLHWGIAAGGWAATIVCGSAGALGHPLGLITPWLAVASLAWSGLWLVVVPNSPRFRRATDARLKAQYDNDYSFHLALITERNSSDLYYQSQELTELRDRARDILREKFGSNDPFARDNLLKLDRLAISYLELLAALREYADYLELVNPDSIERDLELARHSSNAADAQVRDALAKQVTLLENRLARYRQAQSRIALIKAECSNIQTTMKLLIDQAMTAQSSERVGRDIDEVLTNIRESEILGQELAAYNELERELDSTRMKAHGQE